MAAFGQEKRRRKMATFGKKQVAKKAAARNAPLRAAAAKVAGNPATAALNPGAIVFTDIGAADTNAYGAAKSRVQSLLTTYKVRGSLSDTETYLLGDALELMNEYQNNNPGAVVPPPVFDPVALAALGMPIAGRGQTFPLTGNSNANAIDDRFRAIRDFLYGDIYGPQAQPVPNLEHQLGVFPTQQAVPIGAMTTDELRIAAVYGIVSNTQALAPQYKTDPRLITSDDNNTRDSFNDTVSTADGEYRSNPALYTAVFNYLAQVGNNQILASDWAAVVDILVSQGVLANDYQLNLKIDRALAAAQNVGRDRPPSLIEIDLPDLEQDTSDFEIIKENIFALQPAYFAAMFEELKVFQVVDKLVELFQNGVLPVGRGDAGNLLFSHWKNAALRVSEAERRSFYARSLGIPGGDDGGSPNREFKDLFMRFVSAVSSFVRQNTLDNLLRANIPAAVTQQQIRKAGRDLATNLSSHGYGMAYPMATELQTQINEVIGILKNNEIRAAYGAKDMWQVVDQVSALELSGAKNSVKYRTMASAGATVFAWLANKAKVLSSSYYSPILDVSQLQNVPYQSTRPTKNPSDYDLVGACDQWLAVTGTQEESVEKMAEPTEAPIMPSRPIQIPSVARDMLESVGVPAMAYSAGNGKPLATWRR
jgi:hypothetical protein